MINKTSEIAATESQPAMEGFFLQFLANVVTANPANAVSINLIKEIIA
jgi:hypothetical protein